MELTPSKKPLHVLFNAKGVWECDDTLPNLNVYEKLIRAPKFMIFESSTYLIKDTIVDNVIIMANE